MCVEPGDAGMQCALLLPCVCQLACVLSQNAIKWNSEHCASEAKADREAVLRKVKKLAKYYRKSGVNKKIMLRTCTLCAVTCRCSGAVAQGRRLENQVGRWLRKWAAARRTGETDKLP